MRTTIAIIANGPTTSGWSTKKRILVALIGLFVITIGAIALLVVSEWTFIQRLRHFAKERPTPPEWFEPKEIVSGVSPPRALSVRAGQTLLSSNLISRAVERAIAGKASAFLILHDGAIVAEYYAPDHGPTQWTDSASMMKTVTALLVGIAIAEGKIKSIDQAAATYLKEWAKDERKKITIRHLLQMRSGLRPEGEYEDPFSDACYLALGTDSFYVVRGAPLIAEPGSRFDYNNINFQALGIILERATGKRYAEYLSEKLWQPLGNSDAAVWLDHPGGFARTFGFLFATAADWARIGQLFLDHGSVDGKQVVPASWMEFMCKPSSEDRTYGAGLYTGPDDPRDPPFASPDIVALNGRGKQRVYVLPSLRIVIVRVGPRAKPWNDSFFPNLFAENAPR